LSHCNKGSGVVINGQAVITNLRTASELRTFRSTYRYVYIGIFSRGRSEAGRRGGGARVVLPHQPAESKKRQNGCEIKALNQKKKKIIKIKINAILYP
jgi:hypothetical protein